MLLCFAKRVKVCCLAGCQVVCFTGFVNNVPIPVPLLHVELGLDFEADAVAAVKSSRIAATAR